jgi:hypothetical protein
MPSPRIRDVPDPIEIGIPRDALAYIILRARAYDTQVAEVDSDEGSNAADDRMVDALEDQSDNPTGRELRAAIVELPADQRAALVALAWIGRGDFERDQWQEALDLAQERANNATARYLMGIPLLGDLLEDGADKLGVNLTGEEQIGLHHPVTETPSENDRD